MASGDILQHRSQAQGSSLTNVLAFSSAVTAGSLLVVGVNCNQLRAVQSITGSLNGTYTPILARTYNFGTKDLEQFYVRNASAGTETITVTFNGGTPDSFLTIAELDVGGSSFGQLDVSANAASTDGAGGTALDSGATATTAQANEFLVGYAGKDNASAIFTAGSGFAILEQGQANGVNGMLATKVVTATGAYNHTATVDLSGGDWACGIATFKIDTPAPPPPPPAGGPPFRMMLAGPSQVYPSSLRWNVQANLLQTTLRSQDQQFAAAGQWATYDYPNPRAREYPTHLRRDLVAQTLALMGQDQQFAAPGQWKTYDYPNPRAPWYPENLRAAGGVFPALIAPATPNAGVLGTEAWRATPSPVGFRTLLVGGGSESVPTAGAPQLWPVPMSQPYPSGLRQSTAYYVQDVSIPPPRVQLDHPVPGRRLYPLDLRVSSGVPATAIPVAVLPPQAAGWDMPLPVQKRFARDLLESAGRPSVLIDVTVPPSVAWEFAPPRLAQRSADALRNWAQSVPLALQIPAVLPRVQLDFPLPLIRVYSPTLRTWIQIPVISTIPTQIGDLCLTLLVPVEPRLWLVPPETRISVVGTEPRLATVPGEPRTFRPVCGVD